MTRTKERKLPHNLFTLKKERVVFTLWRNVSDGNQVFIYATHEGKEYATGPFRVESTAQRKVCRLDSLNSFYHYPEELYRRIL